MSARYDYLTVGHVTLDLIEDRPNGAGALFNSEPAWDLPPGTVGRPGGGAFYSALQASRLGLRTLILTQGVPAQIEELLAPYASEVDVRVIGAPHTTTLATRGAGSTRSQRVLAWAGPMVKPLDLGGEIVHLAAVARETPSSWRGGAPFVGLTPQGLVRAWGPARAISLVALEPALLPARFDAAVIGERERDCCDGVFEAARRVGATVAVTAGARPTSVYPAGETHMVRAVAPSRAAVRDDLGAGDVFAAAFFVALTEGRTALEAAAFGNAAAALRVAGVGAGAVARRADIEAALA